MADVETSAAIPSEHNLDGQDNQASMPEPPSPIQPDESFRAQAEQNVDSQNIQESQGTSQDVTQDVSQDVSQDVAHDVSHDVSQEVYTDEMNVSHDQSQDISQDMSQEQPQDPTQLIKSVPVLFKKRKFDPKKDDNVNQ